MKIEFIGKFYDNHSLTIINRNIVTKLSKKFDVFITPLDKFDPQYKISSDAVKELKTSGKKYIKSELSPTPPELSTL